MSLDWCFYNEQRKKHDLKPVDESTGKILENFAAGALQLEPADRAREWGRAEGYGLYSVAVIRAYPGVSHRFRSQYESVAVKIYYSAAEKMVQFHREVFPRIWQPQLQKTLHAGITADQTGKRRGYLILEFVDGIPLDQLLEDSRASATPEELLRAFFQDCLITLWAGGYRFWDFRPANLVVTKPDVHMVLIDTETLAAAADEMLTRSNVWTQRNRWEELAFQRLPGQIAAIMCHGSVHSPAAMRTNSKQALETTGLPAALHLLGRGDPAAKERAREASELLILGLAA